MAQSFYPNIGTLVSIDDFPEELQFLETGLQNALDKIYYKELQYVQSNDGTHGYYNLVLVTGEQLKLDLFSTGFSIIINPGNAGETLIPLTLNYNWPVLALISNFNLESFSYLPTDFQNLLNQTLNLSDTDLLQTAVQVFEGGNELSNYEIFVDKVNLHYNLSGGDEIEYPQDGTALNMTEEIRWAIENNTSISDNSQEVVNQIYIISSDNSTYQNNLNLLTRNLTGESIQDYIKQIIIPKIEASLSLAVGFAFPRNILLPVNTSGNPIPDPEQSILIFDAGDLQFSTQGGINFREEMTTSLNYPSQIGNTGLEIDILNAKLDLSKNSNIIEADLDGRPQSFIGIYTQFVKITLPKSWFSNTDVSSLQIVGRNLLIGTGGISGTVSLETVSGNPNNGNEYLTTQIGGWGIGFNYFDLTFNQNAITYSRIEARLEIPGLAKQSGGDDYLYMSGDLTTEGDFNLTFNKPEGVEFTLFDFVTFNITSAELGRENDDFYIGASCEIWFQNSVMNELLNNEKIIIPKVRFYDNGRMEIVGGTTSIPFNRNLNLGPVQMAVTAIHFGSHQENGRTYNYWGFDGAISLDPLGIDARGEGVKYYYTVDNDEHGGNGDSFLRIQTIEVDMVIPGSATPESAMAIINGMISIPDPGHSSEYIGEITLKLPEPRMTASAGMRLMPKYPAFLIDAAVSFPAPIPLGPVGIYGFRGLLGYRYVADKEAVGLTSGEDSWYDYYKYPPQGIHISKFSNPEDTEDYQNPISVGAGTVVGTLFDGGETLSVRAMLLLSLPSVFMIDGRASILSRRLDIVGSPEPPFFAGMVWGDDSIEMWIGADYQIGSNGWILDLYAEVQAGFFFNNASKWYVNFGTKQKPITADALTLFESKAYLMLSASGISTGARADFKLEKRFGPAKVKVSAYVEIGGDISFERSQVGGYVAAGGEIKVDIWIVKLSIGLDALLSVEAAKPFLIYAELRIRACVKIVFARVCKSFTVKLKWEFNSHVDRTPIPPLPYQNSGNKRNRTKELVKGVHMLTNETFDVQFLDVKTNNATWEPNASTISSIIPLDTYIDIKTIKGLVPNIPSSKVGGYTAGANNFTDIIPPEKVVRGGMELRQVKHKYSIEEIELKAYDGNNWVTYEPFKAVVNDVVRDNLPSLIGYWQKSGKQYDTIRLLASNPFTYTESGEPGWFIPEEYGITPSSLFCEGIQRTHTCLNFLNKLVGDIYYPPSQYIGHYINGAYFTLEGENAINEQQTRKFEITDANNSHGFQKSLAFDNNDNLTIILPNPVAEIKFKLTTEAQGLKIEFYSSLPTNNILPNHQLVDELYKTKAQLSQQITYTNQNNPIIKIIVRPDKTDTQTINNLQIQIAQLYENSYQEASGEVGENIPNDLETYNNLLDQIENLSAVGCEVRDKDKEECRKDEEICKSLYEPLLTLFENCFPIPLISFNQIDTKCYQQFISLLDQFHNIIYDSIQEEWNIYLFLLEQIEQWKGDRDIDMDIYLHFRNNAYTIIDKIKDIGNCDCDGSCDVEERVCYYLDELSTFYFNHFSNVENYQEIPIHIDYYKWIFNIFERDILNSTYPFESNFIKELIPLVKNYNNLFGSVLNSDSEQQWNYFEDFKSNFEEILSYFSTSGNCNCEEGNLETNLSNCNTSLQELCWLTLEDFEYNQTIPGQSEIDQQYEDMIAAVQNTAQPIWRPNTKYYIRFRLKDNVDNGENEKNFDYYYAFKTVGPLGHYHKHAEVEDLSRDHPLASLTSYIDYSKSYPDAKGNLLKAKPIFYGNSECKISLYFIKPMVYHMLKSWDSYNTLDTLLGKMHLIIKDPVNNTLIPYPLPVEQHEDSIPLTESEGWNQGENPITLLHLQQLNNMIDFVNNNANEITCTPQLGESLVPNVPVYETILTNLKPNKLYTALVYNAFDHNGNNNLSLEESELIHEYVFKTSRYLNFREQVESYWLKVVDNEGNLLEEKQAVFDYPLEINQAQITSLFSIINDAPDALAQSMENQFYHLFDRALEGVLGIIPPHPPENTEFNKIINTSTQEVVALWIRNPEPFNIPKIPKDNILDTIKVMSSSTTESSGFSYLFSKDYSQVLIMNSSNLITDISLNFMFKYIIWDGNNYSDQSEVYVENIIINPEN